MPHVSRNKLSKSTEQKLIKTVELILTKISKKEDMNSFLLSFLTPTERVMLAKRLAIILLLKEGNDPNSVASTLHVTRGTVDRLMYYFEARGRGYELAFQVLSNEKFMQEVKDDLYKLIAYTARAAGGRVKPSIF